MKYAQKCSEVKVSEKFRAKFPVTTRVYSMVKVACLNGAFSEIFQLEASPVEGQSLSKKTRHGQKGKVKKKLKTTSKALRHRSLSRLKMMPVERKACCHVNATLWSITNQKISKMPPTCVFDKKALGFNGLNCLFGKNTCTKKSTFF